MVNKPFNSRPYFSLWALVGWRPAILSRNPSWCESHSFSKHQAFENLNLGGFTVSSFDTWWVAGCYHGWNLKPLRIVCVDNSNHSITLTFCRFFGGGVLSLTIDVLGPWYYKINILILVLSSSCLHSEKRGDFKVTSKDNIIYEHRNYHILHILEI